MAENTPQVAVIMGSSSDWETMSHACDILEKFHVPYEKQVISAHRTPELMADFAHNARSRGIKVIIAGAGGAAHLPGMTAAQTTLPVIGVPLPLVSYGGSSYLFTISAIALVAACARENAGMTMGLKFSAGSSRDPRLSRRRRRAGKASGGSTEGTR